MIVNFQKINHLKILNYIYEANSFSILLKYWQLVYFLVYWYKKATYPISLKLAQKRYQTKLNLFSSYYYYFCVYFFDLKYLNNMDNLKKYLINFNIKNYLHDDIVYELNETKTDRKKGDTLDLNVFIMNAIYLKINYNYYYNLYNLLHLNIWYRK